MPIFGKSQRNNVPPTILSRSPLCYFLQHHLQHYYSLQHATHATHASTPTTLPTLTHHARHPRWHVIHVSTPPTLARIACHFSNSSRIDVCLLLGHDIIQNNLVSFARACIIILRHFLAWCCDKVLLLQSSKYCWES